MKRQVKVGQEFEVDGEVKLIESKSRAVVTIFALVIGSMLLIGAAAYGIMNKDFSLLAALWAVEGPIFGAIAGHYYK
jgi:hypothetical protein